MLFYKITQSGIVDALRELKVSPFLVHWIENLLRHRTVQVELNGEKIKREVVKGNPQGGILSPFLWNCVLNSLLVDLRNRGFHVQAYADDVAILVTGTNMLWIKDRAQKALNNAIIGLITKRFNSAVKRLKWLCLLTKGSRILELCV